ncbi:hypothetical protein F4774DRAFT_382861 [Daldinia eschscholtzii]|nr:hypothetical protein F4774DRAFT_382861 [Daldinia eschscholtzii]
MTSQDGSEDDSDVEARLTATRDRGEIALEQARRERMRDSQDWERFTRLLQTFPTHCHLCFEEFKVPYTPVPDRTIYTHRFESGSCPHYHTDGGEAVRKLMQRFKNEFFKKKRMQPYSGCFGCGLPQAVCARWETVNEDGGKYQPSQKWCQYYDVIAKFLAMFEYTRPDVFSDVLKEL